MSGTNIANDYPSYRTDAFELLREKLELHFSDIAAPRILEAGCGSGSVISIPPAARLTGIDISQEELEKNPVVDEKIVGDLETYELPRASFDLVVCWDVLEHLNRPVMAMEKMAAAVRPGGVLLLAFPNVRSLKAVVAKYTPLGFHKAINRWIYGTRADSPGYLNFPTVLDPSIAPMRMSRFATEHGLIVELAILHQSGLQSKFFKKLKLGDRGVIAFDRLLRIASFGTLSIRESDCIFFFRRM